MAEVRTTTIDFSSCEPRTDKVYIKFGYFAYEVLGKDGEACVIRFGGDVQDSTLPASLATRCLVPQSLGNVNFPVNDLKADLSAIDIYCEKPTPAPEYFNYWPIIFGVLIVSAFLGFLAYVKMKFKNRDGLVS